MSKNGDGQQPGTYLTSTESLLEASMGDILTYNRIKAVRKLPEMPETYLALRVVVCRLHDRELDHNVKVVAQVPQQLFRGGVFVEGDKGGQDREGVGRLCAFTTMRRDTIRSELAVMVR